MRFGKGAFVVVNRSGRLLMRCEENAPLSLAIAAQYARALLALLSADRGFLDGEQRVPNPYKGDT